MQWNESEVKNLKTKIWNRIKLKKKFKKKRNKYWKKEKKINGNIWCFLSLYLFQSICIYLSVSLRLFHSNSTFLPSSFTLSFSFRQCLFLSFLLSFFLSFFLLKKNKKLVNMLKWKGIYECKIKMINILMISVTLSFSLSISLFLSICFILSKDQTRYLK